MLTYCGWSLVTRWRSTSCIWSLPFLDHLFGCSWCAPWSRASGTPARDHAGHLRKEVFGIRFRRSDDLHLTPGGLQPGLARAKATTVVFITTDLFLQSQAETTKPHPAREEQS